MVYDVCQVFIGGFLEVREYVSFFQPREIALCASTKSVNLPHGILVECSSKAEVWQPRYQQYNTIHKVFIDRGYTKLSRAADTTWN